MMAGNGTTPHLIHATDDMIERHRRLQKVTVGQMEDCVAANIVALTKGLLVQYGPLAQALSEVMARQMLVEDFVGFVAPVVEPEATAHPKDVEG